MRHSLKWAGFCFAALLFASPAFADDATPPPSSTTETYNDWNLSCAQVNIAPPPAPADPAKKDDTIAPAPAAAPVLKTFCEVSQIYKNNTNGDEAARISFFNDPVTKNQINFGIRVLVNVSFDKPIRITNGDNEILKTTFHRCLGPFCYGVLENVSTQLQVMGQAAGMAFEYPLASGQLVKVPMSSRGLVNAMEALKAKQQ